MSRYPTVHLTQPLETRLRLGHPWVFADAVRHPRHLAPGEVVDVLDMQGEWVGRGVLDPGSALRLRMWTLDADVAVDEALLDSRIRQALKRRPFPDHQTTGFRLLAGEGDRIPGLVCDVYDRTAVLRPDGEAAERWLEPARQTIGRLLPIDHWVIRRAQIHRGERPAAMWWGDAPRTNVVEFLEHGTRFVCDPIEGQKTGFFLDQRANRQRLAQVAAGRRLLNLFGYTGGFSVIAAMHGAARTTTIDIARPALEMARRNFELNGLPPEAHEFVASDVFDYLATLRPQGAPFEVAVCDPPSFAHRRSDLKHARRAYERLFAALLEVMPTGSTVALASCSSHVDRTTFLEIVAEAARQARCALVLGGLWGADVDHPILASFPEGDYLQFVMGTVCRD